MAEATATKVLRLGRPGAEKRMEEIKKEHGAKHAKEIQAKANELALAAGSRTIKVEHVFAAEGKKASADDILAYRGRKPPEKKAPAAPKAAKDKPKTGEKGAAAGKAQAADPPTEDSQPPSKTPSPSPTETTETGSANSSGSASSRETESAETATLV